MRKCMYIIYPLLVVVRSPVVVDGADDDNEMANMPLFITVMALYKQLEEGILCTCIYACYCYARPSEERVSLLV